MRNIIPSTTARVAQSTAQDVNWHIDSETRARVNAYASKGPEAIDRRLRELDHEWDIERTLEANAAIISLIGLGLGTFLHRRWYILPTLVGTFLLQHALQGWCPPVRYPPRPPSPPSRDDQSLDWGISFRQSPDVSDELPHLLVSQ